MAYDRLSDSHSVHAAIISWHWKYISADVTALFVNMILQQIYSGNYTVSGKKGATLFFAITLPNPN